MRRIPFALYTALALLTCTAIVRGDVVAFQLIDTATNEPVPGYSPLSDGDTVNVVPLPQVSINAITAPTVVGSVVFVLKENGFIVHSHTENSLPYALFGDEDGSLIPWPGGLASDADYELTAITYTGVNGTGTPSDSKVVGFATVSLCSNDEECTDNEFCNGVESCVAGVCVSTPSPCAIDEVCLEATMECASPKKLTLYVDDDGSQQPGFNPSAKPGSINHPFSTLQQAADAVAPGDTVLVREGTYDSGVTSAATPVLRITTAGTQAAPITFKTFPGEAVVLDGLATTATLIAVESAHVVIDGFELINALRMGVLVGGSNTTHVTVRNCYAHHNNNDLSWIGAAFRTVGPVSHILFEDCLAHDNTGGFQLREEGNQTAATASVPPRAGNIGHVNDLPESEWDDWPGWIGFAPRLVTIRGCMAYDNMLIEEHSDGISARYAVQCTVEDCITFRNVDDGIDIVGSTRCLIKNNISFNNDPFNTPNGDGNGIKIGVRGGLDSVVYRNIAFNNTRGGIDTSDDERTYVAHNTCFDNELWFGMWSEAARSNIGLRVINNISSGNVKGDMGGVFGQAYDVISNNLLSDGHTHNWAPPLDESNLLGLSPQFNNVNGSIVTDFPPGLTIPQKLQFIRNQVHSMLGLLVHSPAIDAGELTEFSSRDEFFGLGPDIGAIESNHCETVDFTFGDMGGAFGECGLDGVTDNHDFWHAINCFANIDPATGAAYLCEPDPPVATVVDSGGSFGDCCPDGFCDANDAFHALSVFEGRSPCVCAGMCDGGGPAPEFPAVSAHTWLMARPSAALINPGAIVDVEVHLGTTLDDLRGYQLHAEAYGGLSGRLELVDMAVHPLPGFVFEDQPGFTSAFNVESSQLLVALRGDGVDVGNRTYLATFRFRASPDARGAFAIELRHDHTNPLDRTFMFNTANRRPTLVVYSHPGLVTVN